MNIRIHVYEYTEWMFASNLSHRYRKPKFISTFWTKHGGDGKRWSLTPFPFLASWHSSPPSIKTPPRPVPAGPFISWPKNASYSRIPPQASHASLPLWRSATTSCQLSLWSCTAPLSYSLQLSSSCRVWVLDHLYSNLFQLFHLCWITEIRPLNLWVCFYLFTFCLCFSDRFDLNCFYYWKH